MAQKTIDLCNKATELNYSDKLRHGNIIELPSEGRLVVTGDLHGHRKNFKRIAAFADLANNPDTYLVFQEILHGGKDEPHGGCLSFLLFFDILKLKLKFPEQVQKQESRAQLLPHQPDRDSRCRWQPKLKIRSISQPER